MKINAMHFDTLEKLNDFVTKQSIPKELVISVSPSGGGYAFAWWENVDHFH